MKIAVQYPSVVAMEISAKLDLPDNTSLKDVKANIHQSFLHLFNQMMDDSSWFSSRFSEEGIVLKDRELVIDSDDALRDRLVHEPTFYAMFTKLP